MQARLRSRLIRLLSLMALLLEGSHAIAVASSLDQGFVKPPLEARPWVYWFWLNGNITSNGITADLEAMKRVGIGGVLIMEVDQGAPVGPIDFMSAPWRSLFQHVTAESRRLGLQVNMNNDAGWNGSGGPWIKPEQSMQKVVWTETNVTGPRVFEGALAQPQTVAGFYRDIAMLAFPTPGAYRIDNINIKAAFEVGGIGLGALTNIPPEMAIARARITNLTARAASDGRVTWEAPPGQWTIMRFGHASTGVENAPAPATGRGLECDKLSKEGIEANFAAMMARLAADNIKASPDKNRPSPLQPKPLEGHLPPGLVATHIDSWENGSQNWTARMREEFESRRGYDILPFLPVMTGRVVESLEVSERFLWDLRQTVSELVIENYAGRMRDLAHAHGMRFTVEAYGCPCDAITYGGRSDEPMGEFWSPNGGIETCKGMASAAHVYGRPVVGAEAFTASDIEKWREHPGAIKALGDRAFCEGINRFVFHRYALQPWDDVRPGMTMGPWGQHYERTQTWWEWTGPWHEYLARCQFLLRQGLFVADICYLQPETPPLGFGGHPRRGYEWDECSAEVVLTRMSVRNGRLVLADGMSYAVLVLPGTTFMTPALLAKVKQLVEDGATVIGAPPRKSPSLVRYPACDQEVQRLAADLWGDCDGARIKERRVGKGRIVWTAEPENVLGQSGLAPDFVSGQPLRYIHRVLQGGDEALTDIYFVANPSARNVVTAGSFRVSGRIPELWWPDTGRLERAPLFEQKAGQTSVALRLSPAGSVFVVFRSRSSRMDPVLSVARAGDKAFFSARPESPARVLITEASYGPLDDPRRARDVREQVQERADRGETVFLVSMMAEGGDPAPGVVKTLRVEYSIAGKSYSARARDSATIHLTSDIVKVTVTKARYGVLDDPQRTRDVREKLQRLVDAGESSFQVARMAEGDDPAFLVVKTLELEYTRDGKSFTTSATDPEVIELKPLMPDAFTRVAEVQLDPSSRLVLDAFHPGRYEAVTAAGLRRAADIPTLPPPLDIAGPWTVKFAPRSGTPVETVFDTLESWTRRAEFDVKYYSGTASYTKTFTVPRTMLGKNRRLYLDLGRVEVMAKVRLNGTVFGPLWKPPFRLDVTSAIKAGENWLDITVVNLWPNRMIGDEQLPEDSDRNPDGTLKRWPQWLAEGKASPTGRRTFTTWRLWKKADSLLESGLLGPVRLEAAQRIVVK